MKEKKINKIDAYWELSKDVYKHYNDLTFEDIRNIAERLGKEIPRANRKELKILLEKMKMLQWIADNKFLGDNPTPEEQELVRKLNIKDQIGEIFRQN